MKQVGWFVVGFAGKFGPYPIGHCYEDGVERNKLYWENRGYTLIPAFVSEEDFEEHSDISLSAL